MGVQLDNISKTLTLKSKEMQNQAVHSLGVNARSVKRNRDIFR